MEEVLQQIRTELNTYEASVESQVTMQLKIGQPPGPERHPKSS